MSIRKKKELYDFGNIKPITLINIINEAIDVLNEYVYEDGKIVRIGGIENCLLEILKEKNNGIMDKKSR